MAYNSTIITKKKQLKCGHFGFNFSKGRCKQCATIEDTLIRMNEANEKDESLSDLVQQADALFSRLVRLKYANENKEVACYTCDTVKPVSEMQNGHYIPRANMLLRFDFRNARPQCSYCNCTKHGNLSEYGKRLEIEHPNITEILYEEAHIVYKYSREELKGMILDFERQLHTLKNK